MRTSNLAPRHFKPPFPDPMQNLSQWNYADMSIVAFNTILYFGCVSTEHKFDHDFHEVSVNVTALGDGSGQYSNYLEGIFCEHVNGEGC